MLSPVGLIPVTIDDISVPCPTLLVELSESGSNPLVSDTELIEAQNLLLVARRHSRLVNIEYVQVPSGGVTRKDIAAWLEERIGPAQPEDTEAVPDDDRITLVHADVTVVICTFRRHAGLRACIDSLLKIANQQFQILVVDNSPQIDDSSFVVDEYGPRIQYVAESQQGLSNARNCALNMITTEIAAWIDDDEIADAYWIDEILNAFQKVPQASAASGLMLPAGIETIPQKLFEQYGGHSKHRNTTREIFQRGENVNPLYPLPPFGTGGNMAFRVSALRQIGGFDRHLGAGTPCMGAEDTLAFTQTLEANRIVVYWPEAVTFHYHRATMEALRRQMFGYGVGLTAFYTSLIVSSPTRMPKLLKLIPLAYRDFFRHDSLRSGHLNESYPSELQRANVLGMLQGPIRYILARLTSWHRHS